MMYLIHLCLTLMATSLFCAGVVTLCRYEDLSEHHAGMALRKGGLVNRMPLFFIPYILKKLHLGFIAKPLCTCIVCMAPWYGLAALHVLNIQLDLQQSVAYIICLVGMNSVLSRFID